MTMEPQPQLGPQAPPPPAVVLRPYRYRVVIVVLGMVVVGTVGWMIVPVMQFKHHRKLQAEAMQNSRLIGLALHKFQSAYGRYPDATTSMIVTQRMGTRLPTDDKTSNDYLRQLIVADPTLKETIFRATLLGSDPDGRIDGRQLLEKGECGFAYVLGATPGQWGRPLLVAPLVPGTDRIDPKPFNGAVIIVRVDGSVQWLKSNKHGDVLLAGKILFDPTNPIWEGQPPVIAWPDH